MKKTGKPWFNMSMQQRQPERTRVYGFNDPLSQRSQASLNTCLSSAYFGGCSVQLSAYLTQALQTVTFRLFSLRPELDQTLYCSYTYKNSGSVSCEIFLVLTFGSGMLTHQAVMGPKNKQDMAGFKNGSAADGESCEPGAKKARRDEEKDIYVSPIMSCELEPLKSSLWFHDLQDAGGSEDHGGWITRHFRLDTAQLTPPGKGRAKESMSVAVSLARPVDSVSAGEEKHAREEGTDPPQAETGEGEQASVLLGHLQIFRAQDLQIQAPQVVNISMEKFDPLGFSDNKASSDKSSTTKNSASPCTYILHWDVEGSDASIDYFNVYFGEGASAWLVGHSPTTAFVTAISPKFVIDDKVTVTIQPVLTVTSLPQVLSKCPSQKLSLSSVQES